MQVSNRDLVKLAILLSKTVHDLDFPKKGKFNLYTSKTLTLVAHLETKYPNTHLLSEVKEAVTGVKNNKMPLYMVTREVLASVNRTVRFKEMTTSHSDNMLATFFDRVAA